MLLEKCAYLRLGGGHPTLLEAGLSAAPAMEGGGHGFAQQTQVFTGICKAIAVALAVRTGKHRRRAAALLRDAVGQLPDAGAVQPWLEVQDAALPGIFLGGQTEKLPLQFHHTVYERPAGR